MTNPSDTSPTEDPEVSTTSEPPAGRGGGDDDRHRLSMTILMTPDMSNVVDNVHGGLLLKYLDQVA